MALNCSMSLFSGEFFAPDRQGIQEPDQLLLREACSGRNLVKQFYNYFFPETLWADGEIYGFFPNSSNN